MVAVVVFPIPGGPESSAALAPGFSLLYGGGFILLVKCVASQRRSQSWSLRAYECVGGRWGCEGGDGWCEGECEGRYDTFRHTREVFEKKHDEKKRY